MAVNYADVETRIGSAKTAIEAGDWDTAETQLMCAQADLAAIPDGKKAEAEHTFKREAVENLLKRVDAKKATAAAASRGIQRTLITPRGFDYQDE